MSKATLTFAVPARDIWQVFVFPYARFLFLQAILLIFLIHGAIEMVTGQSRTLRGPLPGLWRRPPRQNVLAGRCQS